MNIQKIYGRLRENCEILRTSTKHELRGNRVTVHLRAKGKKLTILITRKGRVMFLATDEARSITFPSEPVLTRHAVVSLMRFLASPGARYVLNA